MWHPARGQHVSWGNRHWHSNQAEGGDVAEVFGPQKVILDQQPQDISVIWKGKELLS